MPPHNKVPDLKILARDQVLFKICEIVIEEIFFSEDENWEACGPPILSTRLQIARDIFANALNANILEDILNVILQKDENIEVTVRYIALQLLLVKGVTSLAVGHFPESYYSLVLEAIAESCAELRKLDLKGLWVRDNDKLAFYKLVRRLHKVRHLTLKYVCDDELLLIIGKHCQKLEKLDISGSDKITEDGIKRFVENLSRTLDGFTSDICSTLQIINFGGPGAQTVSPSLASKFILGFPNLKSLGSFEKTGQCLEMIYKENPDLKLGLRYIHDVGTNSQRLLAVSKLCPDLQAVYLDTPGSAAVKNLDILKKIKEIKLNKVKWEDLKVLISNCGSQLRSLFLFRVWGPIDFVDLGASCPELIRLELHFVSLNCCETSHQTAFKKVQQLYLYNSEITTTCAKLIMNQCVAIQTLSLGDCAQLTDAAVLSSLIDHSLLHVQSIWFGLAENLTMRTINGLIEHCPMLTNLGNLAAWNVSEEDIAFLRLQLILTNMDLNLHEFGPEEELVIPMQ